jgi:dTDP-4-dehydrorhamnose reductase
MHELELWAGHECTVNRVGRSFFDQTVRTGHEDRLGDLDLFAELGVKALRYPLLWERTAPLKPSRRDWRWSDARLGRLQELGVRPIAGLVHHGSGPAYTNLLDPLFAVGLAAHARAAAERYPWIEAWTPVNEPLTTARFSALYGHWHPHKADERSFWTALLNQIDATRLAMREIRKVNPAAQLVQTEDLGKTYSTRAVAHQASHDNARRWMTWDLLCGRVTPDHPLWERLAHYGLADRLADIAADPCPPDVIGINHYLTSDRFLDHRCERYPDDRCGANEFMRFADVEAVRVLQPAPGGLEERLQETWARYGLPLAVTESHNGCTREEQMRWTNEAWQTAGRLRERGVEVQAVTVWSLLGAYDWNSLLTQPHGHYEPGAFDVRGSSPRPTAMATMLKTLARGGEPHPVLAGQGWWRRDIRLQFQPVFRSVDYPEPRRSWQVGGGKPRPLLITGATGTLGKALARACEWRGIDYVLTDRAALDLADAGSIARALEVNRPWAVVNAAGWVRVDEAEAQAAACHAANAEGAIALARACAERDIAFTGFSSDLVFDGAKAGAYDETDPVCPLGVYGHSKAACEAGVLGAGGKALMIRTAAFFSPFDPYNFAAQVVRRLAGGHGVDAADDLIVSPTYVPDLVDATLDLVIDGESGLWHLANQGQASWAEFARLLAEAMRLDANLVRGRPAASFGWAAPRPRQAALSSTRGWIMPSLDNAVARFAAMLAAVDFEAEAEAWIDRVAAPASPNPARQ